MALFSGAAISEPSSCGGGGSLSESTNDNTVLKLKNISEYQVLPLGSGLRLQETLSPVADEAWQRTAAAFNTD
ncbi:hypothetical protein EYF80_007639 [Liparis tanakae]|uniref:Uncharacterized protein n=1 Tax=Liparis tanakae TaxID=230148 RepID=A0A4Z2IXL0_9TELE|nr:hypothetical protein EYF80_007639 [Liparis tanakae]